MDRWMKIWKDEQMGRRTEGNEEERREWKEGRVKERVERCMEGRVERWKE